ncbi:hypothetical protein GCM10010404_92040 [Nonomuraea africana]|uniref:SRPBCC family protein n=1 Tax=Nonomuraea africana TaxID=46171 RepID=A0ABR9K7D4_9ACTN|nr:hypothetical protein [Nonomuraea africana]MBE1557683.1 hypothetical protein [Nonomuraea africana]
MLTDFSPSRADAWPTIDAGYFKVHSVGATVAPWERARYEWEPDGDTVTITTLDSKLFGAGGGWIFTMTPESGGTRVNVEPTRRPSTLKGTFAALLPLVAPSSLRKSLLGPLQAK